MTEPEFFEVDISAVVDFDALDPRLALTSILQWADSREVREQVMRDVRFPLDDLPMFLVVNQLSYRGALRPTDLASALGTGKTNISKIVARLEDADLAVRVRSPFDERSVLVALTAAGRQIGERILELAQQTFLRAVAGWTEDEIDTLRRVLARFARPAVHEIALRSPGLLRTTPLFAVGERD